MLKFFKDINFIQRFFVKNLSLIIIIFPILALLFYGGVVSAFISYKQDTNIKKEINKLENRILTEQKKLLKDKAKNFKSFIKFSEKKTYELAKKEIKAIVDMAYSIALNIIKKNEFVLSQKEMQDLIKHSLEMVKFGNNRGYLFINDLESRVVMHPFIKSLEGKSVKDKKDSNGKFFIKEFEQVIKKDGQGFIEYSWYRPNSGFRKMY